MEEQKQSGAIIQLNAYGASDTFLTGIKGTPMPCNIRKSMNYWFVEQVDGKATVDDINVTTSTTEDCPPRIVKGDTWNRMNQRFDPKEFEALEKEIFDGVDLNNLTQ
jgi:hypothetical protein